MLTKNFPGDTERIAAGLVGHGSECYGFDDELSQDHDWGPGFCLWLETEDFNRIGAALQAAYNRLPQRFQGFYRIQSRWGAGRVGAMATTAFYSAFIGRAGVPESMAEWLAIPETNLAACTNGRVFSDPLGVFSAIRKQVRAYYPEDVRLKKMAAKCMTAAQAGQYNYPRCVRRGAVYPARHALATFCEDALALVFLLNRQYMPYFKWALHAARQLPRTGPQVAHMVDALNKTHDSPACAVPRSSMRLSGRGSVTATACC
ncbi:DUF4037 domain-containing protein [Desulfosarcina ovata]|nr:DUF4037 domain-containing protein [Desulfosarcina ovata]